MLDATCLPIPACAKIILTRNPLESYVSLKIAQATGQWKLTNSRRTSADAESAVRRGGVRGASGATAGVSADAAAGLQRTGQTAFYLDYEDIGDLDVLNGLAAFLGVEGRLAAADGTLKKQNPEESGGQGRKSRGDGAGDGSGSTGSICRARAEFRAAPWTGDPVSFVASAGAPLALSADQGRAERRCRLAGSDREGGVVEGFDQKDAAPMEAPASGISQFHRSAASGCAGV